jgi:hypothetical protein
MWSNVPEVRLLLGPWHDDDDDHDPAHLEEQRTHRESLHCDVSSGTSLEGHQVISAYPPQPAQSPPNTIRDTLLDKPVRKGRSSAVRLHAALAAAALLRYNKHIVVSASTNYIIAET